MTKRPDETVSRTWFPPWTVL